MFSAKGQIVNILGFLVLHLHLELNDSSMHLQHKQPQAIYKGIYAQVPINITYQNRWHRWVWIVV